MTLLEALRAVRDHQAAKHDLGAMFTENDINALSPYDLLCEISEALEAANVMPCTAPALKPLPPINN